MKILLASGDYKYGITSERKESKTRPVPNSGQLKESIFLTDAQNESDEVVQPLSAPPLNIHATKNSSTITIGMVAKCENKSTASLKYQEERPADILSIDDVSNCSETGNINDKKEDDDPEAGNMNIGIINVEVDKFKDKVTETPFPEKTAEKIKVCDEANGPPSISDISKLKSLLGPTFNLSNFEPIEEALDFLPENQRFKNEAELRMDKIKQFKKMEKNRLLQN